MCYPAGLFRVTRSASLIHRFQIAGVFNEADMSGILIFRLGVAAVALDARERAWLGSMAAFVSWQLTQLPASLQGTPSVTWGGLPHHVG